MDTSQIEKIAYLDRLKYAQLKVRALGIIKDSDEYRICYMNDALPDKNDSEGLLKCGLIAENIKSRSNENYLRACAEYDRIRSETEKAADSLNDDELSAILKLRYVERLTWEEISLKTFYSVRTLKYKHKRALDALELPE